MSNHIPTRSDYRSSFIRLVRENSHRHHTHEVFRDFCALFALALSNVADRVHYEQREAEYLRIVQRYTKDDVWRFVGMRECVVDALEDRMQDFLGQCFMDLDLGGHWAGQFFTPYEICKMMALMTCPDAETFTASGKRFLTYMEPAAGAGAMIIASAEALKSNGLNYQQMMHVTAIDLDLTAVHMSYIQFSLLHIPAIVLHGNSLTNHMHSHWVTLAHVLGLWDYKLRREDREESESVPGMPVRVPESAPEESAVLAEHREQIVTSRAEQMSLF